MLNKFHKLSVLDFFSIAVGQQFKIFKLFLHKNSRLFRAFTLNEQRNYFCGKSLFITETKINLHSPTPIGLRWNFFNETLSVEYNKLKNLKALNCKFHDLNGLLLNDFFFKRLRLKIK